MPSKKHNEVLVFSALMTLSSIGFAMPILTCKAQECKCDKFRIRPVQQTYHSNQPLPLNFKLHATAQCYAINSTQTKQNSKTTPMRIQFELFKQNQFNTAGLSKQKPLDMVVYQTQSHIKPLGTGHNAQHTIINVPLANKRKRKTFHFTFHVEVKAHQKLTPGTYEINLPFRLTHKEKQHLKHHHKKADLIINVLPSASSCEISITDDNGNPNPTFNLLAPNYTAQGKIQANSGALFELSEVTLPAACNSQNPPPYATLGRVSGSCSSADMNNALLDLEYNPQDPVSFSHKGHQTAVVSADPVEFTIKPVSISNFQKVTGSLTGSMILTVSNCGIQ